MVKDDSPLSVKIVVGANYGDEGKGLASRYFSLQAHEENKKSLIVLFNGGSQRGHTADLKNRPRHVFHHFGSGSFDGSDTYFDEDFIVNPMVFVEESEEPGFRCPKCFISEKCRVTLPYDMMVNQIAEIARGDKRHGSCGYGIWETQKRYEDDAAALKYGEMLRLTDNELMCYLKTAASEYIPRRLHYYGITKIPAEYKELFVSEGLMLHYINDFRKMSGMADIAGLNQISSKYDTIIFEGGQGLALDENAVEEYPNVTASGTGAFVPVKRAMQISNNIDIEICYVSRSYFTRHGAGRLPGECTKEVISPDINDYTNVYNMFQGSIRYAEFNFEALLNRTMSDFRKCHNICGKIKSSLLLTHLNFLDTPGGKNIDDFNEYFDRLYLSYTKYAEDVTIAAETKNSNSI